MTQDQIFRDAQRFLQQEGLPGWLIYDYRHSNPIFWQIVTPSGHVTRPCFLYVPASGFPQLLAHHVDAGKFAGSGVELLVYHNRQAMMGTLQQVLSRTPSVAMEYSPHNELPRVSRVDAGTVELVRSLGVGVVSSADLMQYATQRWTPEQLEGHRRAAAKLGQIVNEAFQFIGARLQDLYRPWFDKPALSLAEGLTTSGSETVRPEPVEGRGPTEYEIAEFIRQRYREEGLEAADGPIVSVNAHCSDPHYEPMPQGSSVIQPGDWVLIDLWAREADPPASPLGKGGLEGSKGSVYADITWTAYVGDRVPQRHQEVFDIVIGARDAALQFLEDSFQQGETVQGWQADAVARQYIQERGYGQYFTHRLGHSISYEVHGEAVNLDGFETHDTRRIIPGIGFSIEPGIYLPEFGVRSEIDAYMSETGPYATSPVQRQVVLIGRGEGRLQL
jgi:Xaa-Pro aminopeptidase